MRELMFKTDVASKLLAENVTFFPYEYGTKAVKVTTAQRLKSVIKSVDQVNDYANHHVFTGINSVGDVDIDCPEGLHPKIQQLLPPTGMIFGRESTPGSHRLYKNYRSK